MFRRLLQQLVSPPRPATARPVVGHVPAEIRFKVIVADFYDRVSSSGGEKLAELLQGAEGLDVASLKADFDLSFLNFESRNFFDLIDRGQNLLEKTGADVLIWGCREENRLRLNFQTPRQYEKEDGSFVCLLDSMYLPADALTGGEFPQPLLDLLTGTVVSAADRPDKECRIYKKYLLKKIIAVAPAEPLYQALNQFADSYRLNNYEEHFKNIQRIVVETFGREICAYDYNIYTDRGFTDLEVLLYFSNYNMELKKYQTLLETKIDGYFLTSGVKRIYNLSFACRNIKDHPKF